MDIVEIQAIYYMVAATGVLIAAGYYILNMRTQRANMRINQETRQIQIIMDIYRDQDEDFSSMKHWINSRNARWTSFDDYQAKYGPTVDPEGHSYRLKSWRRMHMLGLMVRDGLVSIDTCMDYMHDTPASLWTTYGDLIREYRARFNYPPFLYGFEYLGELIMRYRADKGWGTKPGGDINYPPIKQVND